MIEWLIKRLRPWEGWDTFLPLLAVVLCLPGAVADADWVPKDDGLFILAFCALLVGRWLALQKSWGLGAWLLIGAPYGLLAALGIAAHTWPVPPWANRLVSDFAMRWLTWLEAAVSGGVNNDPDIFLFYVALLCWAVILLVAWAFYRRQHSLLALALILAPSALAIFYSRQGVGWVIGGVASGILLLALGHFARARRAWDAAGVDYSRGLNFDIIIVSVMIAFVVALFSLFGPQLTVSNISDWFWRTFEEPSSQVEDTMDRLFGGVSLSNEQSRTDPGVSSYMPQHHLLGDPPELLNEVVMQVQTDEPPPMPEVSGGHVPERETPRHYWQGMTMDHYSGRGWLSKVDYREEVWGVLPLPAPPEYREVTQHFEFIAPHGDTLYTLNAPSWVAERVEAVWGGPGDLGRLASEVLSYTVVSRLPSPTANDLRAVRPIYANEIRERYLQLPETVPLRVLDLAQEVVAGGDTVYEQARLLEHYLRGYPYSLDIESPPEGWDVADYFLFGVREGYCDYYATTFVVMARAAGIPARLASGYVEGAYAPISNAYIVHENDAHSWPEVYFPDWGWIRFEPTASRTVTELPEAVALPEMDVPEPTGLPARVLRARWRKIGQWGGALLGLWLLLSLWRYYRRRRAMRAITLSLVWGWTGRGGARLGLPPDFSLTPREYATTLAAELHERAERTRRQRKRWIKLAQQGSTALERLATLYTLHTYGGQRALGTDKNAARHLWVRLSGPLRWFRWLGWMQRTK